MDYREFIQVTRRKGGIDGDLAERAARATLTTLAKRLSPGQARDLLEQLPAEMEPWLHTQRAAEGFDIDEFLCRVAEREGADVETVELHAHAVFYVLGRAVSCDEIAGVADQLRQGFAPLVGEARCRFFDVMPAEDFLAKVAERVGLGVDEARRATEAVLEALAERIAGGEADDLIPRLPLALHGPLRRGRATSGGTARRMPLDRFVDRIAELAGVDPFEAREYARAVFATLCEAVQDEYFYVTFQLPPNYHALLPEP
ncbi:DUF2267 domain-containing protein [Actinoallomurus sp. NPDC050550]|uniref:DUF2267 domain-containing protein n=1 Tax=Actinoallomurus sp. NPDC050550 TaxID=3154937 RepID=UPI00340D41DD